MPKKDWSGFFNRRQIPGWFLGLFDPIIRFVKWLGAKLFPLVERGGDLDFLINLEYEKVLAWANDNRWWIFPVVGLFWLYRHLPDKNEGSHEPASPSSSTDRDDGTLDSEGRGSVALTGLEDDTFTLELTKSKVGHSQVIVAVISNFGSKHDFNALFRFSDSSIRGLEDLKSVQAPMSSYGGRTIALVAGSKASSRLLSARLNVPYRSITVEVDGKKFIDNKPLTFNLTIQLWVDGKRSFARRDAVRITADGIDISELSPTKPLAPGASAWNAEPNQLLLVSPGDPQTAKETEEPQDGEKPSITKLGGTISKDAVGVSFMIDSDNHDSVSDLAHCITGVFLWKEQISKPRYVRQDDAKFLQIWPQGRSAEIGIQRSERVLTWSREQRGFCRPDRISPFNPIYSKPGTYWVNMLLKADGKTRPWHLRFGFDPANGFMQPSHGTEQGPSQ